MSKSRPFPGPSLYPKDSANDQIGVPGINRSATAGKIVNREDFRND